MDKNSILEFNNKESASSRNHFFSSLKLYHKVEMSDMCVCFNYQNSIKLFTSIFTSTGLAYVNRFLHFMLYVQLPFPTKHVYDNPLKHLDSLLFPLIVAD